MLAGSPPPSSPLTHPSSSNVVLHHSDVTRLSAHGHVLFFLALYPCLLFCLDLSSGNVYLKVFSGDLVVCETTISYYTDMEEIGNLLSSAANPVEFMCQVSLLGGDPSSQDTGLLRGAT